MVDETSGSSETEANQDAPAIKFKKELAAKQAQSDAQLASLGITDPREVASIQRITRIANEYQIEGRQGGTNIVTVGNRPVESPEGSLLYSFFSYDKNNPKIGHSGIFELPSAGLGDDDKKNFDFTAHQVGELLNGATGPELLTAPISSTFDDRQRSKDKGTVMALYKVDQHPDSLEAFARGWHTSIGGVEREMQETAYRLGSLNPVLEQTMATVFKTPPPAPVSPK